MQGDIGVTSVANQGSNFYFTVGFDTQNVVQKHPLDETHNANATPELDTKTLNILLVEDNEVNQKIARLILEKLNHQVTLAQNGLIALQTLKETQFDLILMDMQMPEMDGITATKAWRDYESQHSLTQTPIIAMTANAMEKDKQACLEAGMNNFIAKPLNLKNFQQLIQTFAKVNC